MPTTTAFPIEASTQQDESLVNLRRPQAAITGATGGLGSAFARQLAAKGYALLLNDISADRLEQLATRLREEYGVEVECFAADLCAPDELRNLLENWGDAPALEVLVNCAGFGGTNHYAVCDMDRLQAMMQVHVTASAMLTRAVLPGMLGRDCGYIINVASIMAYSPRGPVSYGSTKQFLIDFSERLQHEIRLSSVKIQALCPGVMRTAFFDDPYFRQMNFAEGVAKLAWLDVDYVVTQSLQALKRRRVVCIPGRLYQAFCAIVNHPWMLWLIGYGSRVRRRPPPTNAYALLDRQTPPSAAEFQKDLTAMKSVVVTGVSTGIGCSAARVLVRRGFRVFGTVRKLEDAAELQAECGPAFTPILCNVRDDASVREAARQVEALLGGQTLWGLVNNAGIAVAGPLMHVPMDQVRSQMEVNITGLIAVTQAFLPLLGARFDRPQGIVPGRVVNISSISGIIALPMLGAYAASKYAVEAISRALRTEIAWYDIPVIVIEPGPIESPIWSKMIDADLYQQTDYETIAKVTAADMFRTNEDDALPVIVAAEAICRALSDEKPRERYVINKRPAGRNLLARWIPQSWVDRYLRKKFRRDGLPASSPR